MKFGKQLGDYVFVPLYFIIMLMNGFIIGAFENEGVMVGFTPLESAIYGMVLVEMIISTVAMILWFAWRVEYNDGDED